MLSTMPGFCILCSALWRLPWGARLAISGLTLCAAWCCLYFLCCLVSDQVYEHPQNTLLVKLINGNLDLLAVHKEGGGSEGGPGEL